MILISQKVVSPKMLRQQLSICTVIFWNPAAKEEVRTLGVRIIKRTQGILQGEIWEDRQRTQDIHET